MRKTTIGALALLALAGCADRPKSGEVYDRKFHPAFYYTTQQCASYDSKGQCTLSVPVLHYWPDSYELCLADGTTGKRGCRPATLREYETYQIGNHYPDAR